MVVLQALVEGMVLEVHVTNRQALETGSTPTVEIYTQFGSQVRKSDTLTFFGIIIAQALTLSRFVCIPCNRYTYNMTLCICSLFNMIYIVCAILSGLFLYLTISRVQHLSTKNLWSKALLHGKKKRNRILDHGMHT